MKGQVLHLLRVQLKVPGDSSDFSVRLTKTESLMFSLRLNYEMSGGSEKILLVSLFGRAVVKTAQRSIKITILSFAPTNG